MTHTPLRRCRVCRQARPKAELVRWIIADGVLTKDPDQKAQSRGYYSCEGKCSEIIPKTIKGLRKD